MEKSFVCLGDYDGTQITQMKQIPAGNTNKNQLHSVCTE